MRKEKLPPTSILTHGMNNRMAMDPIAVKAYEVLVPSSLGTV